MASSGNFCTINPLGAQGGGTIATGTLSKGNTAAAIDECCLGTIGVTSGKWYWEWALTGSSQSGMAVGWANEQVYSDTELGYNSPSSATGAQIVYMYLSKNPPEIISDAPKSESSGTDTSMSEISQNDIIGVAADFDNDKWYFSINGSFTNARSGQDPATGANPLCSASGGGGLVTIARTAGYTWFPAFGNWAASTRDVKVNFGQDSTFSGSFSAGGNADESGFGDFKYSVPAGFKAMCSGNLPTSSDIDPSQTDSEFPQKQFNAIKYTGNSSTNAISGLGFQPDMVWFHRRDYTGSYNQGILDSSRGVGLGLYPDRTNADTSFTSDFNSFDSDGFTLKAGSSANINNNSATFVAWCWRANGGTTASNSNGAITSTVQANTKAGFSIVQWTANATSSVATTVGHGLSKAPEFVITKSRDSAGNWCVTHTGLSSPSHMLFLNSNGAQTDKSGNGSMSANTSTVFSVNATDGSNSPNGDNMIAYCWHSVEGYSKFGGYTGNQNTDGNFVYTGFRPRLLAIRNLGTAGDGWRVYDSARETANVMNLSLSWHNSNAESTGTSNNLDFLSNGFKLRAANPTINWGSSYGPYIYMAWADVPAKYNNAF